MITKMIFAAINLTSQRLPAAAVRLELDSVSDIARRLLRRVVAPKLALG